MPESTSPPPAFNYAGMQPVGAAGGMVPGSGGPVAGGATGGGSATGGGGGGVPAPAALVDNLDAGARSVL